MKVKFGENTKMKNLEYLEKQWILDLNQNKYKKKYMNLDMLKIQ